MRSPVPTWFHESLEALVKAASKDVNAFYENEMVRRLHEGSKDGIPFTKYILGLLYDYLVLRGVNLPKDQGCLLIIESAALGWQEAIEWCVNEATDYFWTQINKRGPFLYKLTRTAAKQGDARAQFLASMLLEEGIVVMQDSDLSAFWLEKAMSQGFNPETWMMSLLR